MELYLYNSDIELQGVIDGYSSLRWRRRFFEPGEFELHAPATPENIALLAEGNILHRLDRREAGIIEGVAIAAADRGGDEIAATGRMGSSMLDRRIVAPAVNFSGTVEAAMRKLVSDNAITARPLPHLILGSSAGLAPDCTFQAEWKTVLAVCEALGRAAPLGFRVRLDVPARQWVFEACAGTDRSAGQTAHPQVVFCAENENISKASYTRNSTGYANCAVVGGEGDGAARVIAEVDQTGGEPRRELWVDAKDLKKGSLSDADYRAQLTQRGAEKLAEAGRTESFTADAVNTGNFAYLTDWDLGDIVSFENWGIRIDERITEVEEVYENGTAAVTPTCGSPLPETLNLGDDT